MQSSAGLLLGRAASLLSARDAGFTLTLSDVTAEEFIAIEAIRSERDKYADEKSRQRGAIPNRN